MPWLTCVWMAIGLTLATIMVFAENISTNQPGKLTSLAELRKIFTKPDFQGSGFTIVNNQEFTPHMNIISKVNLAIDVKGTLNTLSAPTDNQINLDTLYQLPGINKLWIMTMVSNSKNPRELETYLHISPEIDKEIELSELHIDTPMQGITGGGRNIQPMKTLLTKCSQYLEVLNLKNTMFAHSFDNLVGIFGNSTYQKLKALAVSAVEIKPQYSNKINISRIFQQLASSPIEYLDLSNNRLAYMYGSFIKTFPRLRILDLSHNMFTNTLEYQSEIIFLHPTIEVLNLNDQNYVLCTAKSHGMTRSKRALKVIPTDNACLGQYQNEKLIDIFLHLNLSNEVFYRTVFDMVRLADPNRLRLLDTIELPYNSLRPYYDYIANKTEQCYLNIKFPTAPNLKELHSSCLGEGFERSGRATLLPDANCTYKVCFTENKVEVVTLAFIQQILDQNLLSNYFIYKIEFSGFEYVKYLDISFNRQSFSFFNPMLKSFPRLENLNLAFNNITFTSANKSETLQSIFPFIHTLDISNNNLFLDKIDVHFFVNSFNLKMLNLAGNSLKHLHLHFDQVPQLRLLNISSNNITKFSANAIAYLKNNKRPNRLVIDLRYNKIECGCPTDELDTIDFIQKADLYNISFVDATAYTCILDDTYFTVNSIDMYLKRRHCTYPHLILYLSLLLSNAFVLSVCTISLACYKYRYRILRRYLQFKLRLFGVENGTKVYDAFVLYAREDEFWTHSVLITKLEKTFRYELCVPCREFVGGAVYHEEMNKYIKLSKSLLIVVSNFSLNNDEWAVGDLAYLNMACQMAKASNVQPFVVKLGKDGVSARYTLIKMLIDCGKYVNFNNVTLAFQSISNDKEAVEWLKLRAFLNEEEYDRRFFLQKISDWCRKKIFYPVSNACRGLKNSFTLLIRHLLKWCRGKPSDGLNQYIDEDCHSLTSHIYEHVRT